jgi:hypothetical protein
MQGKAAGWMTGFSVMGENRQHRFTAVMHGRISFREGNEGTLPSKDAKPGKWETF